MKHSVPDAPLAAWAKLPPATSNPLAEIKRFVLKTLTITEVEVRKLRHDPTALLTRVVQPVLWLLVFGQVLARVRGIQTGGVPYLAFMAPGIMAQSVLFVAIFYGITVIWERDLGVIHKFLVSPTPHTAIVLGKAIAAGVRGLSQAIVIYVLSALIGVPLNMSPLAILGVIVLIMLIAALFSTFSLIIACLVKNRERFMGIGQVMTMPMFFASNAIYPVTLMPGWLQVFARVNPLTYAVDGLRALMIAGVPSSYGIGWDAGVLLAVTAGLVVIGGRMYARVVQ